MVIQLSLYDGRGSSSLYSYTSFDVNVTYRPKISNWDSIQFENTSYLTIDYTYYNWLVHMRKRGYLDTEKCSGSSPAHEMRSPFAISRQI